MIQSMSMSGDAEKDLAVVLSYLTGRKLTLEEVLAAVEMSRSTYYDRQAKGTLTTTDTLLKAARNLGLNPVDLLVRYGRIEPSDVADFVEEGVHPFGVTTVRLSTRTSPSVKKPRGRPATIAKLQPRTDAPPL
jgi:transcriptional regulator with XRE-family HTH domain